MHDAYPGEHRLPQSYADEVGLGSATFTYDAAVAMMAWLADGSADSVNRARQVGAALAYAQDHDPDFGDGRLRRGYAANGFVRNNGTVNVRFPNTVVGDMAVAGIGWTQLAARTNSASMRSAAVRLATWITAKCANPGPLGGYTAGTNNAGMQSTALSTAHNADLVEFFRQLAKLTGDGVWRAAAANAESFVRAMFLPARGRFAVGSPDGTVIDRGPELLDAQTRPVLALGARYEAGVAWAEDALSVLDTPSRTNSALRPGEWFTGVTVSSASLTVPTNVPIEPGLPKPDRQAVWFEGTAQFAAALRICPNLRDLLTAGFSVSTLATGQQILARGQHVGGRRLPDGAGVPAASSPLHIGTEDSGYYPVRHVGATSWLLLGSLPKHPWRPVLTP